MTVTMSNHARKRLRQRGVAPSEVALLLRHGANSVHHRDCELITLGREGEENLREVGAPRQVIDRLRKTAVVLATDADHVVTVIKLGTHAPRRYRRAD